MAKPFFPLGIFPSNHWIGGWVDPRAGLDTKKETIIAPDKNCTSTIQPTG